MTIETQLDRLQERVERLEDIISGGGERMMAEPARTTSLIKHLVACEDTIASSLGPAILDSLSTLQDCLEGEDVVQSDALMNDFVVGSLAESSEQLFKLKELLSSTGVLDNNCNAHIRLENNVRKFHGLLTESQTTTAAASKSSSATATEVDIRDLQKERDDLIQSYYAVIEKLNLALITLDNKIKPQ